MDYFGIGAAMRSMISVYIQSARRTGRTTSMVESLKDGDRVVFVNRQQAEIVERLCKKRGISIEWTVVSPCNPQDTFRRGSAKGRLIFDHVWVEQYYKLAIERAMNDIDRIEREASGYGATHRENQRSNEEIAKFEM